jgi:hypothetical protein
MKTDQDSKLRYALLAIALSIMLAYSCKPALGDVYDLIDFGTSSSCITPLVTLESGADQTSAIYAHNTSAKITINATSNQSTYNYSLNIVNNDVSPWEVKLECFNYTDINQVNTTIALHNNANSCEQITINGGTINQTDQYYGLAANATIYLGIIDLIEGSEQTTILQVYLRIKTPNITTYTLYIITFEFT